jgi:SAM-dependent methyltransferase
MVEASPRFPPTEYMRLVCGDQPDLQEHFDSAGSRIVRGLHRAEMLEPGARLLDIGCGCGRVARHLMDSPIEAYAGFDRHPGMIEWALSEIGARDGRFRFQHVDVRSDYDELDKIVGSVPASEFVFPYEDESFTGVLAASVFTHTDFAVTGRYLEEAARVLVPGGRVLASLFLDDTTGSLAGSSWNFTVRKDDMHGAVERAGLRVLLEAPSGAPHSQSWYLLDRPLAGVP